MDLTIHYKLNEEEFREILDNHVRACAPHNKQMRLAMRNRRAGRVAISLVAIILCLPALLFLTGVIPPAAPSPGHPGNHDMLEAVLPGMVIIAIILLAFVFRWRRKRVNLRKHAASAGFQTIRIQDDALTFSSPTISTTTTWQHFAFWHETPHLLLLYTHNCTPHIFPKRTFPDDSHMELFRSLCHQGIDKVPGAFPVSLTEPPSASAGA